MESSICLWIRNELILEFVIFAIVYFIGGFSEIIMINKIVASVVWRIDVDELDHAGVVLAQELQCVEVISFDVQVLGGIPVLAAFFDRSQGFGDGFAGQSFRLALARPCELVTFAVPLGHVAESFPQRVEIHCPFGLTGRGIRDFGGHVGEQGE